MSCCFVLLKEKGSRWRNNQNICLFKWMALRACTERQSPSLRLWGYSEPPINQHAGAESSVLEEMHSDLAYAYSGGITRGNIGAQRASGVQPKASHSACKCSGTEGRVRTARCFSKCSFPASLTRLLLLFFFSCRRLNEILMIITCLFNNSTPQSRLLASTFRWNRWAEAKRSWRLCVSNAGCRRPVFAIGCSFLVYLQLPPSGIWKWDWSR